MINGKVSDSELFRESFTFNELMEAVKACPWDVATGWEWRPAVNTGFFVRWLMEWVVENKREHFEVGEIYVDARSRYFYYSGIEKYPWTFAKDGGTVNDNEPVRPLRKLIPEDTAESVCTLPHEIEGK